MDVLIQSLIGSGPLGVVCFIILQQMRADRAERLAFDQARLGLFVFERTTMLPNELSRRSAWEHPSNERIGARPAYQFTGPGEETVSIPGRLVPELGNRASAIETLRQLADAGDDLQLLDGTGTIFGSFRITAIDDTRHELIDNGLPRAVDFTISLVRTD